MLSLVSSTWWLLVLRGLAALLVGIAGFVRPEPEVVFGTMLLVLVLVLVLVLALALFVAVPPWPD